MTLQIERVAVVGAGYVGGSIAQVLALAGFDVVVADADATLTRRHLDRLYSEAEDDHGDRREPACLRDVPATVIT